MVKIVTFGSVCEMKESKVQSPSQISMNDALAKSSAKPTSSQAATPPLIQQELGGSEQMVLQFTLEEFVDLSDGRRITLRTDRGFGIGPLRVVDSMGKIHEVLLGKHLDMIWRFLTRNQLTQDVLTAVEPDDESNWLNWMVDQLRSLGVEVNESSVLAAPYRVEFGPLVLSKLEH